MASNWERFTSRINILGEGLLTDAQVAVKELSEGHFSAFNQRIDIRIDRLGEIRGLEAGYFAFFLMPILDAVKAYFYSQKIKDDLYNKPKRYKQVTLGLHILKALATLAGVIVLLTGAALGGFLILAAANAVMSVRSLGKAVVALFRGDFQKAGKHLVNFFVSAAFTAAFTIAFVGPILFPAVLVAFPALAWGLAVAATGLGVVSNLWKVFGRKKVVDVEKVKTPPTSPGRKMPAGHKVQTLESLMTDIQKQKQSTPEKTQACDRLKNRAESHLKKFKDSHPETIRSLIHNDVAIIDKIKGIILKFVDGEGKNESVSQFDNITDKKLAPYYEEGKEEVFNDKEKLKCYYLKKVLDGSVCDLLDQAYLYESDAVDNTTRRNEIATQTKELISTSEFEDKLTAYKTYEEVNDNLIRMTSASRDLEKINNENLEFADGEDESSKRTKALNIKLNNAQKMESFDICCLRLEGILDSSQNALSDTYKNSQSNLLLVNDPRTGDKGIVGLDLSGVGAMTSNIHNKKKPGPADII